MKIKQTTERRISAAVRIALVAALCLANIALLLALGFFLQTFAAYIYLLLEALGRAVPYKLSKARLLEALP